MLIGMDNVKQRFGDRVVLDGLDLVVAKGEIVALAGVNGAGKSTTMDLLMGYSRPTTGEIAVLGHSPAGRRHLGEIGWMPEQPSFPSLRVRHLIRFQQRSFPRWDEGLANELIDRLQIDPAARADRLSRGQRGRLALLFALAHRPRLLLLDDPTLGLDPGGRRVLIGELLSATAESGTGVLISTHLLVEIERSLDRLVVLSAGKALLDASVDQLRSSYRRLHLPPTAPPLPAELAVLESPEGTLATAWHEASWREYRAAVPVAWQEPADVESVFIHLTRGAA